MSHQVRMKLIRNSLLAPLHHEICPETTLSRDTRFNKCFTHYLIRYFSHYLSIYLSIILLLWEFFTLPFHLSLSDIKSPQVSRTLLSILADFNSAVVCMVSTSVLISNSFKSSSLFTDPLVILPGAPITTGITVTFMFRSFFQFPSMVQVLIFLFAFLQFYLMVCLDGKVQNLSSSLFFVDWYSGGD